VLLLALATFGDKAMRHWHAQFDEIEAAYQKAFPGVGPAVEAPEVSDATILHMGGDIPRNMQDPELRRAKQLGQLNADGSPTELSGNWGSTVNPVDINGTTATNPAPSAINLQGPDDKAETLTVTLCQPIWSVEDAHAKLTAVVQYGNGGFQNTAEIDWVQGTTFQVRGSFLRVSARIDVESGPVAAGSGATCAASAFATKLDCPRQSELIKSFQVGALAHASFDTVIIFAGVGAPHPVPPPNFGMLTKFRYMWANTGTAVTKVIVDVFDHNGNTLYTVDLTNDPDQWIPLLGRASEIRVTNADGANDIADSYLVFNVEL
jgi:hypothetical protein